MPGQPAIVLSQRERILAAFETRLREMQDTGLNVFRSRRAALGRKELPAALVEPVSDRGSADDNGTMHQEWQLTINVRFFTRGDAPDAAAEALLAQAHGAIMRGGNLDGLALSLLADEVSFSFEQSEGTACESLISYRVLYRTPFDDWTIQI